LTRSIVATFRAAFRSQTSILGKEQLFKDFPSRKSFSPKLERENRGRY